MADRKAFIDAMAARLKQWDAELAKLEAKGQDVATATKAEYTKHVDDLRRKKATAERNIEELERAGEDAWEKLSSVTETAFKDMTDAVQSALAKFK